MVVPSAVARRAVRANVRNIRTSRRAFGGLPRLGASRADGRRADRRERCDIHMHGSIEANSKGYAVMSARDTRGAGGDGGTHIGAAGGGGDYNGAGEGGSGGTQTRGGVGGEPGRGSYGYGQQGKRGALGLGGAGGGLGCTSSCEPGGGGGGGYYGGGGGGSGGAQTSHQGNGGGAGGGSSYVERSAKGVRM